MRRLSLTSWIFIGMAAGVTVGIAFPHAMNSPAVLAIANVFLRLIKSIIAFLIFGTLVAGIAGTGSIKAMGRIGLKAIVYFEVVTTIALFLGLATVNLVRPGAGMFLDKAASGTGISQPPPSLPSALEHTFPQSIVDAMARGEVLQIVVFALLFGAACASLGIKARPVVEFCQSLADIMFQYTKYVMYLAPLGVGAAMAYTIAKNGTAVLFGLAKLVVALYATLVIFVILVFGISALVARIPVKRFLQAAREPTMIAFSTASSEAALPLALENMESFGVPQHIVAFVLPTGYSFNLTGSTLYLSLAAIFVAQAAGMHMSIGQQLMMMLTLMLTSKGTAGVPRSAIVILSATITSFDLPAAGISLLLGADALLDMGRTAVNVLGNCMATAVVARWEGVDLAAKPELVADQLK